jgi:hypothetical protein
MNKMKKGPAAAARPAANKANVATGQGAITFPNRYKKREQSPVPIAVALKCVHPDSQIARVMACLARSGQFLSMPLLSGRSGSLNIHSVIAQIRRRFEWVIENKMQRCGLEWHSEYLLVKPKPLRPD